MHIRAEGGIELTAALWANEYPLVQEYFGEHLAKLLRAVQSESCDAHFAKIALCPHLLEARLGRIEGLEQTQRIMSEVGNVSDPENLDKRLANAWSELRVIDQLRKEGFDSIQKVEVIADLTARKGEQAFAFQVTRINKSWRTQVTDHSELDVSIDRIGYGDIREIYKRLSKQLYKNLPSGNEICGLDDEYGPLSYYFWDTIEDKNDDFKKWDEENCRRCLVIVSNEEGMQDSMVRHVACRLICEMLHNWLQVIYFEELLWLPDAGNGAWFTIGPIIEETRCFADWSDEPGSDRDTVCRREVDLDSVLPAWKA
jgi:hypothetical protein